METNIILENKTKNYGNYCYNGIAGYRVNKSDELKIIDFFSDMKGIYKIILSDESFTRWDDKSWLKGKLLFRNGSRYEQMVNFSIVISKIEEFEKPKEHPGWYFVQNKQVLIFS